ncbi:sensor histidine kinase [Nocardiopsis oceani]
MPENEEWAVGGDSGAGLRLRGAWAHARRRAREFVGLWVGLLVTVLTLVWALLSALVLLAGLVWPPVWPRARGTFRAWTRWLCDRDLDRLACWMGATIRPEAGTRVRAAYLLVRFPLHLAALYLVFVVGFTISLLLSGVAIQIATGTTSDIALSWPGVGVYTSSANVGLAAALVMLVVLWALVAIAVGLDRWLARTMLGPTAEDLLHRRIDELTQTRTGIVRAVDEERRRIERDLHDGVQQRVVALAMLLGRAQRGSDPERTATLVRQAHTESRVLLDELREVAWRIYPTALDTLGLEAALTEAAERGPLPVVFRHRLYEPLPQELATAVYFVAREAMTNAAKHSGADEVMVDLHADGDRVELVVSDHGRGGADTNDGGLTGLARRVNALDGTLRVDSPVGGPTTVRATLPLKR